MSVGVHGEHKWEQIGSCVYCADCNVRLFRGMLPTSPSMKSRTALCLEEIARAAERLLEEGK